jgi:uncharacterized protein (DUF1778 family)
LSDVERVVAAAKLDGVTMQELIQFVLNTAITRAEVVTESDVEDEES